MIFNGISKKIITLSLGIIFVTISIVGIVTYQIFTSSMEREIKDRYIDKVVDIMASIDETMYDKYRFIQDVADNAVIKSGKNPAGKESTLSHRLLITW